MDQTLTNLQTPKMDGVPHSLNDEPCAREIAQDLADIASMEEEIREFDKQTSLNHCRFLFEKDKVEHLQSQIQYSISLKEELNKYI
jgi:hypothetical protein